MKILILGASGLTGYKAAILASRSKFEVYGTYNSRNVPSNIESLGTFSALNLNNKGKLAEVFNEVRPNVVLNCTAMHNVDYCELHPDEAFYINSEIVSEIAALCNITESRLVQVSTDYIFDGKKQSPYVESDSPNPLNVYAQSKVSGEKQARKSHSYSIIRPSVVYGWTPIENQGTTSSSGKPMNFALWVLHKLKSGEVLNIVDDQYASPTLADNLAQVMIRVSTTSNNDIYHVAGNSCLNRYQFTRKIAQAMGYPNASINPIKSDSFNQKAKRPLRSCLNCNKVKEELNIELPAVEESLLDMRSQVRLESASLLGNR